MKEVKRVCKICGNEFDFWHSKAKTCGKECSKIYEKFLKRQYLINNKEKCRKSAIESYYRNKKPTIKKCKICGKDYNKIGNNLTCSINCKLENIRRNGNINSKIWVKKHPEKRKEVCRKYTLKNSKELSYKSRLWAKRNPDKVKQQVIKWRKRNKKKRNCQARAQYNIPIPLDIKCEICKESSKKIERHHPDYDAPLKVIFLCSSCHRRLHTGIIKIGGVQ